MYEFKIMLISTPFTRGDKGFVWYRRIVDNNREI